MVREQIEEKKTILYHFLFSPRGEVVVELFDMCKFSLSITLHLGGGEAGSVGSLPENLKNQKTQRKPSEAILQCN